VPADPPPLLPRTPTWRTSLTVPAARAGAFADLLGDSCDAVSSESDRPGLWRVTGYAAEPPDRPALETRAALLAAALGLAAPAISIDRLEPADWLADSLAGFPPIRVGRFHIRGSHVSEPAPPGGIDLLVDATIAFGTGEHPTTAGCLLALERLARGGRRPARILDMGCGTGILAVAAAKLFRRPVLAADISADAVAVARHTALANRVGGLVRVVRSDGYRAEVMRGRPYDLILANILARPLVGMAGSLAAALAPGGAAVLSGLLAHQERLVATAHRARGLRPAGRIEIGVWPTLVMEAPYRPTR
jgi:ribosomal protein L11 methyltransferase